MLFNFINLLAEGETNAGGCGSDPVTTIIMIVVIVLLFGVTLILPMFTGKKRQKEANEMLETLSVGDEIMTRSGVIGTIVELQNHESGGRLMVVETGRDGEKTTLTFAVEAMYINYTKTKQRQEQLARQKEEKEAMKHAKDKKDHEDVDEPENKNE